MKKVNALLLSLGLSSLSVGMNNALSSNENDKAKSPDAVVNAQTVRKASNTGPDQKKNEHDRSDIFAATNALPSSQAFQKQPDNGKVHGFDFYRDPLNAKKPMQTFEETMEADVAERPKVVKAQN